MNFFNPYLNKKQNRINSKQVIGFLLIVVIIMLPLYYHMRLLNEKGKLVQEINALSDEINLTADGDVMKSIEEAEAKNNAIVEALSDLDLSLAEINSVNNFEVTKIDSVLDQAPVSTYINQIDFNSEYIDINCISDSYETAAQFVFNLKNLVKEEYKVFMPKMNENQGDFEYTINLERIGESNEND